MPIISRSSRFLIAAVALGVAGIGVAAVQITRQSPRAWESGIDWKEPPKVDPGEMPGPAPAPSDAIVLFDGTDFSQWEHQNGGEPRWEINDDGSTTVRGGGIRTKQGFGDIQLHLEWASPEEVRGNGQGRGNSGVFLMGRYEVQILDSYDNDTYYDGQAGAVYKQSPPLVNASRPPGQWQSYDIIFEAPRFTEDGSLKRPAYMTVLHNGVLIQNRLELQGDTPFDRAPRYDAHPEKLPISLQDHRNPVKFRNIWVRELKLSDADRQE